MNDDYLEQQIRSLNPAPLPQDLVERMSAEPIRPQAGRVRRNFLIAAAAAILVATCVTFALRPDDSAEVASDSETPVSLVQKESTLLDSRTLAFEEHDGQLWEVSEEEWQDDTLALCSTVPAKLRSTVIRREVVCAPVEFQ